ncbi:MAG: hypothetical protein JKY34_10875 [Kordiimonadaceae bacterium]|nr:hypothetical protein [Kordiimonadaceae bacterium]
MSVFSKILSPLTDLAGSVIDKVVTDKNQAMQLKHEMSNSFLEFFSTELKSKRDVLIAELTGESFLQRNWRPIVMCCFTFMLMAHWFGLTPVTNLTVEERLSVFELLKLGIGGYIFSRGAEKVAKNWKGVE